MGPEKQVFFIIKGNEGLYKKRVVTALIRFEPQFSTPSLFAMFNPSPARFCLESQPEVDFRYPQVCEILAYLQNKQLSLPMKRLVRTAVHYPPICEGSAVTVATLCSFPLLNMIHSR